MHSTTGPLGVGSAAAIGRLRRQGCRRPYCCAGRAAPRMRQAPQFTATSLPAPPSSPAVIASHHDPLADIRTSIPKESIDRAASNSQLSRDCRQADAVLREFYDALTVQARFAAPVDARCLATSIPSSWRSRRPSVSKAAKTASMPRKRSPQQTRCRRSAR